MDKIHITEEFAKDIAEFKDKERELEGHEDKLYDLLVAGTIDREGFNRQIKRIRSNRASLADQLEALQKSLTSIVAETAKSILELAISAKSKWISTSAQERRQLLDKILSNPILDGLTVQKKKKKPFAVLVKMAGNEKWRARKDSNLRHLGSKPSTLSS